MSYLALPAEALWLASDAVKRTATVIDDVGELVSDAASVANTAAGQVGALIEHLTQGTDELEARLTAWHEATERAFQRHHDRVTRLERILSLQYGGRDLETIERGVQADVGPDERLPVWSRGS